jgi:hypothetical protein
VLPGEYSAHLDGLWTRGEIKNGGDRRSSLNIRMINAWVKPERTR